ncbi:MAG: PKD domain-containing protein [Candidatus Bathyarchaeota archaeon]|nr:PKD domain-containing protein [Candidatus Bathyarchaeota archaeon]
MVSLKHSKSGLILFTLTLMLTVTLIGNLYPQGAQAEVTGTVTINGDAAYAKSVNVTLTLSCDTAVDMQFSNDNSVWSDWETYSTTKAWNLTETDSTAERTVYVNFRDAANETGAATDSIIVDPVAPTAYAYMDVISAADNQVLFYGGYSTDDVAIASYYWDYGDGHNATGLTTNHTYTGEGNYTGYLKVTDLAGNTANCSFWVKVPIVAPATPTPTPAPTAYPTIPSQPTVTPSLQPSPTVEESSLSPTAAVVIVAVTVIVVVGIVIVLVISRSKPKSPTAT